MRGLGTHIRLVRQLESERERPLASILTGVAIGFGAFALLYACNRALERLVGW